MDARTAGEGRLGVRRATRDRALAALVLILAGTVVWWPFARHMVFKFADLPIHLAVVERMRESGRILEPHFLFHAIVIAVGWIVPGWTVSTAAYATLVAALIATVVAVYLILASGLPEMPLARHLLVFVPLSYAVVLAGPMHLLTPENFYMGYVAPNAYHSPTLLVLKPIALALFWTVATRAERRRADVATTLLVATLTVLSALAKPHFVLCLVPAVLVLATWDRAVGRPIRWSAVLGVVGAGLPTLGWQYELSRHTRLVHGIVWAPFAVVTYFSTNLAPKFVASILFPLAVVAAVPAARRDRRLGLAWLAFAFGCVQAYGFAEGGPSFINGNLLWSAQIACAVLYVASAKVAVDATVERRTSAWALAGVWAVFALHVASGLLTYWYSLTERWFE